MVFVVGCKVLVAIVADVCVSLLVLFVVCLCGCLSRVACGLTLFVVRCRVLVVIVAGVCSSLSVLLLVVCCVLLMLFVVCRC